MNIISRGIKAYAAGAAAAVLVAAFAFTYSAGRRHQRAADAPIIRAAQLGEENAVARADSTHHVVVARIDSATGKVHSADVAYRRAEQLRLSALELTDSLRIQRTISAQLRLQADTLRARVAAAMRTDSAGTRYASFHQENNQVAVHVDVAMPTNDSARATIVASVKPPIIDIDGGCRDAPPGGVRSAYLAASAPGWGKVTIGRVAFNLDSCNAIRPPPSTSVIPDVLGLAGAGALGYGLASKDPLIAGVGTAALIVRTVAKRRGKG